MIRNKKLFILLFTVQFLLASFAFIPTLSAVDSQATIRFSSAGFTANSKIAVVKVLIDSTVPINAYDVTVNYDPVKLSIERVDTSDSLITIWQEPVTVGRATVGVKGANPKAFSGSNGHLMTLYFKALEAGETSLSFTNIHMYQADGKGTSVITAVSNAIMRLAPENVALSQTSNTVIPIEVRTSNEITPDKQPPIITEIYTAKNPFDPEVLLLVFTVSDEASSAVTARVRTRSALTWSQWQEATNPYAIPWSSWAVELQVFDGSYNIATKTFYRLPLSAIWLFGGLLIAVILLVWISRRRLSARAV